MKRTTMAVLGLMLLPFAAAAQQTLEFDGRTWLSTDPDAKVETFMGRQALLMRSGAAYLPDLQFRNGTVEYDVATTGHRSFVGTAFRIRQVPRVEYEHFYIRPHQTGRFDATQYTPEINGLAAWQLYPEYNAPVEVPAGTWIHVRLVIEENRLEAFIGEGSEPTLVVDDLRLDPAPGLVGLTSNFPQAGTLDLYPTAYSNVRILPDESTPATAPAPREQADLAPGTITSWALSESHAGLAGEITALEAGTLDAMSWEPVHTDALGRVNIAEHRAFPSGASGAHVYARVRVRSDRAQTKALNFGVSDRGLVYLNGRLIFSGNNTYRSRSLRYLGVMTVENDALYLPLEAGENELVIVVSESFGGWGLVARFRDTDGISLLVGARDGG